MKILYVSDLHIEFDNGINTFKLEDSSADVVVLAGDIGLTRPKTIDWVLEQTAGKQAIYLLGNHEFYNDSYQRVVRVWRDGLRGTHVHFLNDDSVVIDDVTFTGGVLWTDYELMGETMKNHCMQLAYRMLNDHRIIFIEEDGRERRFLPGDALALHQKTRAFFEQEMQKVKTRKHVMISHHAPSPMSVAAIYNGDDLNAAFASDLTDVITKYQPDLFFHGHTHTSFDYKIGKTRVLCNPRGYSPFELNPDFDISAVVEI